jgi:hypothetical protein
LLLASASTLGAQTPSATRVFATVTVANLDSSSAWYERHLGTKQLSYSRARSGIAENAVVGNDYLLVELIHFTAKAPSDTSLVATRDIGLKKFGVWVSAQTFRQVLGHLQKEKATFVGGVFTDDKIGAMSFIVRDNSGVLIQFFSSTKNQ